MLQVKKKQIQSKTKPEDIHEGLIAAVTSIFYASHDRLLQPLQ